jgi:hypothetical protein
MMEMRKREEHDRKGDVQNAENAKKGPTFRKIQLNTITKAGKHWLTLYCDCVVFVLNSMEEHLSTSTPHI